MDTARIAALLRPFLGKSLPKSQLEQISIYIDLLLRWNAHINLTAIRQQEAIVTRHFGESFFMASHLFPAYVARTRPSANAQEAGAPLIAHSAMSGSVQSEDVSLYAGYRVPGTGDCTPRVLDIGSGAGFPAFPIKLWAPQIHLTLIESNHKKAIFLREVARALTLTNVDVLTGRAEALAARPDFPRADVVTLRAVEHFDTVLPQAVSLLAPNGVLALLIGSAQLPRLAPSTALHWNPPINIPQSHSRVLAIGVRQ